MCGITGFLGSGRSADAMKRTIAAMADTLHHRGPDDTGHWIDERAGVALGHTRLSILDLSPQGHQPMASASRRHHLVYNGEIYNHQELRSDLQTTGRTFRGHSDTEVLVEAIDAWGVAEALRRANGMFAFAVWDSYERRITLARDRLGIKPLYYGWIDDALLFGSELKALKRHPAFNAEIDRNAIALLLQHSYIPAPHSIYEGIHKLPPGTLLIVTPGQTTPPATPQPYWELRDVVEQGMRCPFRGNCEDAVDELEQLLRGAVRLRMEADVPVGAFLSGGIDSSAVVALMQSQASRPVRTFSIGFEEPSYNEAAFAKAVANHLATEHTEQYVTSQDALDVIPKLPDLYDEPFADSSQIPTYLVSAITRQHVTVSLSGDGGDELFGGYDRYARIARIWQKVGWAPRWLRASSASCLEALAPQRAKTWREVLRAPDAQAMYRLLHRHWSEPVVRRASTARTVFDESESWGVRSHPIEKMMHLDALTYLPGDILTKVDRASMAVSLEARVPLLDHRVVEFAWSLPLAMKVLEGRSKLVLRKVLQRYVPNALVERPKVGFGVPIDRWLRGPLCDWAEALLDEQRLKDEGFFHPEPVRNKWTEHLSGARDWHYWLWDVLMFQAWLAANR